MTQSEIDTAIVDWLDGIHPGEIAQTVNFNIVETCFFCCDTTYTGVTFEEHNDPEDPHMICQHCAERVVVLADAHGLERDE